MKKINSFLVLMLAITLISSCKKDEEQFKGNEIEGAAIQRSDDGYSSYEDSLLIQAVKDSLQTSYWINLTTDAGTPLWECSYIEYLDLGTIKIVVPWENSNTGEIENLLVAFKLSDDTWRVKLINKYYYLLLQNTTDAEPNLLVYQGFLKEFEVANGKCDKGSDNPIELADARVKVIAKIVFDDGTIWWIHPDGSISVTAGEGGGGGGDSGTIEWTNGSTYDFGPNDNSNSPGNWNSNEEPGFDGCGWCSDVGNNAGGGSSTAFNCMNPALWSNASIGDKKDYVNALSDLINSFDIDMCNGAPSNSCLSAQELLCLGMDNNCLQFVDGDFDEDLYSGCMAEILAELLNDPAPEVELSCNDNATNFIDTYKLTTSSGQLMSIFEFKLLIGGFLGNITCGDQGDFDATALSIITTNLVEELVQEGLIDNNDPALNLQTSTIIANLILENRLEGPYPEALRDEIIASYNFLDPALYAEYMVWCAILTKKWVEANPGQSLSTLDKAKIATEAYWKTVSGELHVALDILGLIPGGGIVPDFINGVLYTIEGDGINASISFAATIPIAGWLATGARYAKIAVEVNGKLLKLTVKNIDGVMDFGSRSNLRTMLDLGPITTNPQQAHHLIAWAKRDHVLVQHAARADDLPFHMNHPHNGKPIDAWRNTSHPAYNNRIEISLDKIRDDIFGGDVTNVDPNLVTAELRKLETFLADKIDEFPNLSLNNIIFEYIP